MTAALLGPVGAAPPASGSGSSSGSGSASGSGDGARGESTFAGLLSILAGSPAAGAEAGSPASGTPTPASGKGGRHASGPDDDAAQTPAAAVAGTLVATVLTTGGTVPLALPNTPGSPADAITATATAGAAPTAVASAAAGSLTAGSASGTARPAPMAGHAGFATTLTAAGAPGAQSGTQPGGIATTLPVTGPDGSAQPVPPQQATQNPAAPNPAAPNPAAPNPAAPQPTTPQPTSGPVQPAPLDAEPVLPGAIAAGTAAQRIAAQGSKHTHVSPQQPLPIAGEAASHTDASQLDPSQLNPGQLGSAPLPQAAPSAPLPPVVAPTPNYAGVPVDPQPELSGALARLRSHGDGSHELTVSLHPAELGAVNVSAMLRGDQLTVTVACSSDAARAAVTAALPNLHHQLAGAGFGGVDVQFGSPSQNPSQNPAQGHREPAPGQDQPSGRHRAPEQPTAPERRRPAQDAALDRLL